MVSSSIHDPFYFSLCYYSYILTLMGGFTNKSIITLTMNTSHKIPRMHMTVICKSNLALNDSELANYQSITMDIHE